MGNGSFKAIAKEKIDIGPAVAYFGEDGIPDAEYLGRTQGEISFEYGIDTFEMETEEDGVVDEVITADNLVVTVPIVYTDVDTLSLLIPWGELIEHGTESDNKRLIVPKAVGRRLSDYADKLQIRPIAMIEADEEGEDDPSKDLTLHLCYPRPGPINFAYARDGTRIANVDFVALQAEDSESVEDPDGNTIDIYPYFSMGDSSITGDEA